MRKRWRRPWTVAVAVLAVLAAIAIAWRFSRPREKKLELAFATVETRDITVTIEATGTVEPIDLVEVKSKASGQIVRMPVQVGSVVRRGDLLAQIDTRDVQNQYDQALAALRAAKANADIAKAQKARADDLFGQQVITAAEHESAVLDDANAQAQLVKARTDLDIARQRLEDATVRAPIAGTVLEQTVANGQVISSATSSASGGTTLLKMADLGRIRMRALVAESDVGSVHPGQTATVTVEAFPQRPFTGQVEKIEPQAVVQQSVTMFPVLISISNESGLLLPGMNGEVSMTVDERHGVAAIPVDAVRSMRELTTASEALGLDPDSVRAQVDRQVQERVAQRAQRPAGEWDGAARATGATGGVEAGGASFNRGASGAGRRGAWRAGADSSRAGGRGARGAAGGDSSRAGRRSARGGVNAFSGSGASAGGGSAGAATAGSAFARRAQVAFVKTDHGLEPRLVRLGISDFDYSEVLSGLQPGEQVALLGVAEAQAMRQETQNRIRQRMGGGMPGVPGGSRTGGGGSRSSGGGR